MRLRFSAAQLEEMSRCHRDMTRRSGVKIASDRLNSQKRAEALSDPVEAFWSLGNDLDRGQGLGDLYGLQ